MKQYLPFIIFCIVGIVLSLAYIVVVLVRASKSKVEIMEIDDKVLTVPFDKKKG